MHQGRQVFKREKIIGIDFSKKLIDIAQQNLAKTAYRHIAFIQADAITRQVPDARSILFLYNPFNAIILEKFLLNNQAILKKNDCFIIYAFAEHKAVFEKFGFNEIVQSNAYFSGIYRAEAKAG